MLLINNRFNIVDCKQYSFEPIQELCADVLYYNASDEIRFICVYRLPNSGMSSSLLFLQLLLSEIALVNVNKVTIIIVK